MHHSSPPPPGLPQEVMQLKAEAKRTFQERYSLAPDPDSRLLVFMGRMTHQKGCDIIARAALHFMDACPKVGGWVRGAGGAHHGCLPQGGWVGWGGQVAEPALALPSCCAASAHCGHVGELLSHAEVCTLTSHHLGPYCTLETSLSHARPPSPPPPADNF